MYQLFGIILKYCFVYTYTVTADKCFSELCKNRVAPMIATDVSVLMGVSQPMVRFNVFYK